MRASSRYILGGIATLAAETAFLTVFGWPVRVGQPSPQVLGIFLAGLVCLGYGIVLLLLERQAEPPIDTVDRSRHSRTTAPAPPTIEPDVADAAMTPAAARCFDAFKAFAIANLRPDNLLASLRKQRPENPDYPFCYLPFRKIRHGYPEEKELSRIIRRVNEDEDVLAAVARVAEYGFQITIDSDGEPSGRELHVAIRQDEEAELTMRMMERLD